MLSWKVWCKCNVLLWKWYLSHYLLLMEGSSNGEGGTYVPDQGSLKAGGARSGTVVTLTVFGNRFLPVWQEVWEKSCCHLFVPLNLRNSLLLPSDGGSDWKSYGKNATDLKILTWDLVLVSNKRTFGKGRVSSMDVHTPLVYVMGEVCPLTPNLYVEALNPSASDCDCIWR